MVLFSIRLNGKYYYCESNKNGKCIIKTTHNYKPTRRNTIISLLNYIIEYNSLGNNYRQFILSYRDIFKDKIRYDILHNTLSLDCLSKKYIQTSSFINDCLDNFYDYEIDKKIAFMFSYIYHINNISDAYYTELRKNSFETVLEKELNEYKSALNIQKYNMEYFKSLGFYYHMLKMESTDLNYQDACKYIITVYGLFDRLCMQGKYTSKSRMDLLSQKKYLADKFNHVYELLKNGCSYEKLLKDPKLKCSSNNISIFKNNTENIVEPIKMNHSKEQQRNDYTGLQIDPDYFNKVDNYFSKEFTKGKLGKMDKPSWFDSSKRIIYLYSKPMKERSKIFLGKYEYNNGVFELTNENTYQYSICRIERLVYYLLKQELNLYSTNKKLIMTLQNNIFKSAKYQEIERFTIDDLYSDIREQYISLYQYKETEDRKKALLEKEKKERKEYWDSLSDEEQKRIKIKAMYAKNSDKKKNESKNIDAVLAKQEASATVVDKKPNMKLSSRGTSISINNHIKKIEETDIELKVYMTYKFYDLSNSEDKKGFLEALTYKLKMKDIDTKLYKVSSIKRTKLYAECLEINLVKR